VSREIFQNTIAIIIEIAAYEYVCYRFFMEAAHHVDLTGIAFVALGALIFGLFLEKLKQPAIVGYIVAGVALGPAGLSLVSARDGVEVLAEMGVLMLLFIIGMELSLRAFLRIWRVAVATTVVQITASTGVMLAISHYTDASWQLALLLGFVVALSSTAVAIKILADIGELRTKVGQITVGVLIAQDIAVVPMMLTIGALGGDGFEVAQIPIMIGSVVFLGGLILYGGRDKKIPLPFAQVISENEELAPIAGLAFCFGCSAIAGLIGLSAAYGAFIAGLIIGNSHARQRMLSSVLPIKNVLMMVFFLSIGLLIDLHYMWANIGMVTTLFLLVTVFKTFLNVGFLRLVGQPWPTAFLAGVSMAQIGEFSFLLAVVGISAGVLDEEGRRLIVSVTVLSLALSPLWVITARRFQLLASYGVTEATELLRLVYGPETEALSNAAEQASSRTQLALRVAALNIRKVRNKRRRKKATQVEATKKTDADAETSPSDETATAPASKGSLSDTIATTATNALAREIVSAEEPDKPAPSPRKKQTAAKKPKKSTPPLTKKSSRTTKPKKSDDA
jgi:CPA2 family monovalent cation:H+ antiporter-2